MEEYGNAQWVSTDARWTEISDFKERSVNLLCTQEEKTGPCNRTVAAIP